MAELITPIEPRRADPERVETELTQLWNDVSNEMGTEAILRARSMTLVAFTDNPGQRAQLQETLAVVSRRHPSRAIVILERPDAEPALDTWISVHCQLDDHTSLCNEQVMIEARSDVLEQLASLVLSLIVPDLPIAVWWWGDVKRGSPIFDSLYDLSDRFLLDAATFQHPIRSLAVEANDLLITSGSPVVTDLAWEESVDWRDLITQLFDVPQWAAYLSDLARIRLFYDWAKGGVHNPTEALLVAGWIANRLEWQPASAQHHARGHYTLSFDAGERTVHVDVRPTDAPMVFQQGIAVMEMETVPWSGLRFQLSRQEDEVCGTLKVTRGSESLHHRTVSLEVPDRQDAMDRCLSHMEPNRLFGDTLRKLAPLLLQLR